MKTKTTKPLCTALVLFLLAVPRLLTADVFLKQKQHTDAYEVMGQEQPATDLITSVWMTKDKIRSDNEENSFLLRQDREVIYFLDHRKKTYAEMPMDMSKMMPSEDQEQAAMMQNMMKAMMKVEITVMPTGESKKIGKWNCKKYIQKIQMFSGPMESEIWASEEIKIDYDLYTRYGASMFARMPGMQGMMESMLKEMKKMKGVPVLTISKSQVMGQTINSSTELLDVKEGKAPAGIFELPKGYRKAEIGK